MGQDGSPGAQHLMDHGFRESKRLFHVRLLIANFDGNRDERLTVRTLQENKHPITPCKNRIDTIDDLVQQGVEIGDGADGDINLAHRV